MIKKIDTHYHLWDLKLHKHSWLIDDIEDSFLGNYEDIRKDYLIEDYIQDFKNQNIIKSVHIQSGWDRADSIGETKWLQLIADKYGFPNAIVAYINLAESPKEIESLLVKHCQYQNIRGIRQILSWHENPFYSGCSENYIENPIWQKNFGLLEKYNLSFDMQIYPMQMQEAFKLAKRYPNIQIILNHAGMLFDKSSTGINLWRNGLRTLALLDNVFIKNSGLGMLYHSWDLSSIFNIVNEVIEIFGVDRCMFGSNFPVDKLYCNYDRIFDAFHEIIKSFSRMNQEKLFCKNAEKFYRI